MKSPSPDGIFPLRSLHVRFEKNVHAQFVAQMGKFGAAFGFKVLIKPSSPLPYDTFFQMWRHDIDLIASNDFETGPTDLNFTIGLYPKRGQPEPAAENVAPLVEGLRHLLDQVPGLTVTEVTTRR